MSIPTFVAIKDGEVLGASIGVQDLRRNIENV